MIDMNTEYDPQAEVEEKICVSLVQTNKFREYIDLDRELIHTTTWRTYVGVGAWSQHRD
jgi:hypothetical protein